MFLLSYVDSVFCSTWTNLWTPDEIIRAHMPEHHSDFRDKAPQSLAAIYVEHEHFVQQGRWMMGLTDCWCPRNRVAKHSVHVRSFH